MSKNEYLDDIDPRHLEWCTGSKTSTINGKLVTKPCKVCHDLQWKPEET